MNIQDEITGLILAGGRGTRMGGRDKGLELLHGRPMVAHVLEQLRPQVGSVRINANRNLELYREFGLEVIPDDDDSFSGPLSGILAGLKRCKTRWMMTAPCDTPVLPIALVSRLRDAVQNSAGISLAYPKAQGQVHPVFMLLDCSLLPSLDAYLRSGERKMDRWAQSAGLIEVDFSDQAWAFDNINSAQELEAVNARKYLQAEE
jgi:molybdopterin-guanine dinucleotide biosynthesis protein A